MHYFLQLPLKCNDESIVKHKCTVFNANGGHFIFLECELKDLPECGILLTQIHTSDDQSPLAFQNCHQGKKKKTSLILSDFISLKNLAILCALQLGHCSMKRWVSGGWG